MWAQHNPRFPLGVIALISKGCFWQISRIIIKFVFSDFLYFSPSWVHVVLNWYWAHFGKSYRKNEIGAWSRSCFWPLIASNRLLVTNREPPEPLYAFKPKCRTTFETPWGKLQNLLGMNLTTDVSLLLLLSVVNDTFICFLCHGCWLRH